MDEQQPKPLRRRWHRRYDIDRLIDDHLELRSMAPAEIKRYCGGVP